MLSNTKSKYLKTESGIAPRYAQLKERGRSEFTQSGNKDLVIRNKLSALNTYMMFLRLGDTDLIGSELGSDFDREIMRLCDMMRAKGRSARTIEDRCGFLVLWREIATRLSKTDTLPDCFDAALKAAIEARGVSFNSLSRATGIGSVAIADWASGKRRPARDVFNQITKLEDGLILPAGTLTKRLGFVIERYQVSKAARHQTNAQTAYGKRLRSQYHSTVRLRYLKSPHKNVRIEWARLIEHKVNEFRPRASTHDTWRVKPEKRSGSKASWASTCAIGRVAAADAAWAYLSRYLSWLCLCEKDGGGGIPEERISTLAWVLKSDLMQRCLGWVRMRSGGILHRGQVQMLNYSCMLLRPDTGWLWLNPQIARSFDAVDSPLNVDLATISDSELKAVWQAECGRVWRTYKTQGENLSRSKNLKMGRDPREPIADILQLSRPLSVLMSMLATLKQNPPPIQCFKTRAVWLRDVLLLSFLTANPLRVQHFSTMTYRGDRTGNLYKSEGVWHYRALSEEFKNGPGDYDVKLPPYVGIAIDQYLEQGRPHLLGADTEYLFRPAKCGPQTTTTDATGTELPEWASLWTSDAISIRVRLITRGLRNGLPGFGPHAIRHIVATDYLKRYPGAYKLVAHLLNDTLETVIKEYGHVSPQDGLELHYKSAEVELSEAMGE